MTIVYSPSAAQGGSAGPVTVSIPAGAVGQSTLVTLQPAAPGSPVAPSQVGGAVRIGPGNAVFQQPANITLSYDPAALQGTDPGSLTLFQLVNGEWREISSTVNPANHSVTASLSKLDAAGTPATQGAAVSGLSADGREGKETVPAALFSLGHRVTATVTPPDRSTIGPTTPIVIVFSQSMKPVLRLEGVLIDDVTPTVTWSTTNVSNDTVTIAPAPTWHASPFRRFWELEFRATEASGRRLREQSLHYHVDTSLQVLSASPATGAFINSRTPISLVYSASIDPASVTLGGSMAVPAPNVTVSTTTLANDTVTITPTAGWADSQAGPPSTLSVTAKTPSQGHRGHDGDDEDDEDGHERDRNSAGSTFTASLTYTVDADIPSGSVSPASGAVINGGTILVVSFSETMVPSALSLTGSMATPAPSAVWSTVRVANDTLTLTPPVGGWGAFTGDQNSGTLSIVAPDRGGNALFPALNLAYTVDVAGPTGTAVPASAAAINGKASIVITFSESIDPGSLALSGTMASQAAALAWSNGNTVLTLSPTAGGWTDTEGGPLGTLVIAVSDLGGNLEAPPLSLSYLVDANQPTASVNPPSASVINGQQPIAVTFNDSMDPGTLALGGSLAGQTPGVAWSQTALPNDTLTLTPPAGGWANTQGGPNATLTVSAADGVGNPLANPLSLNYEVDADLPQAVSVVPASGSVITATAAITVVFNEPIVAASLVLGGGLAGAAGAPVFSQTTSPNDTVTLSPTTSWPLTGGGPAGTLSLVAADLGGNQVSPPINLTYTVGSNPPVVLSVAPPSGSSLPFSQSIKVVFDRSLAPGSLVLGGSLAAEGTVPSFLQTTVANDTVVIAPTGLGWNLAHGSDTLTLQVSDTHGVPLPAPLSLSYHVVF